MSKAFQLPARVELIPGGFVVVDVNNKRLAYVYARDDLAKLSDGGRGALTTDEARTIADAIVAGMNNLYPPMETAYLGPPEPRRQTLERWLCDHEWDDLAPNSEGEYFQVCKKCDARKYV